MTWRGTSVGRGAADPYRGDDNGGAQGRSPWGIRLPGEPDTVEEVQAKLDGWRKVAATAYDDVANTAARAADKAVQSYERERQSHAGRGRRDQILAESSARYNSLRDEYVNRVALIDIPDKQRERALAAQVLCDLANKYGYKNPKRLRDIIKPRSLNARIAERRKQLSRATP